MDVPESDQLNTSPISGSEFGALYPGLRRFAAVVSDADCDPDDLVQDALVSYLRRFEGTNGAADPQAYLRSIIVGLASNHRRSRQRQRRRERFVDDSHHSDAYPSETLALLDAVSPTDRALLAAVDIEGESIGRAASALGLTAVAARARLSRARRVLRRNLYQERQP